jgi:hypothetical protein
MKNNRLPSVMSIVPLLAGLLTAVGLTTAAEMPDVIKMENPAYSEHTKPIVEFPHNKHTDQFPSKQPELFSEGCGTCHHDEDGQPLVDLTAGDAVNPCIECHSEPGRIPGEIKKQMREENLSREERQVREREYHAEALHDKCRGCHRSVRKKDRSTSAPTTCLKCHTRDDS